MAKKGEIVHGTMYGYTHRKCRCDACTTAFKNNKWGKHRPAEAVVQTDEEIKDERLLQELQKRFSTSGVIRTVLRKG